MKTNAPSKLTIAGRTIKTNALPDPFDELDLVYRPKLQPLPHSMDRRAGVPVLDQTGESCTGHAVAALIDTVLSELLPVAPEHGPPSVPTTQVSPYMLYAMARRYDEFPGQADVGSSLRGAFKGWYHHGVCSQETWPAGVEDPDLYDPAFVAECFKTPLGAYYRVNARRIDDMQSAITELNAIAVSAAIHEGWRTPKQQDHGDAGPVWVIERSPQELGGHAFFIAGYNDVGFLIQNSWGTGWGHGGYATLPYDDWLDHAYDAWVARPGVPQVGVGQRRRLVVASGRSLTAAAGPNLGRLKSFVIDVTAGGRLSEQGKVTSSPSQIAELAKAMAAQQDAWVAETGKPDRRLVLYAHGGLVGENGGISTADRMIDWWRANRIYPVHIVWESDAATTIFSSLGHLREALPFGGLLDVIGGNSSLVIAPNNATAPDSRSKAKGHGEFDDDPDTMTSVVLRILRTNELGLVTPYPSHGMPTSGT